MFYRASYIGLLFCCCVLHNQALTQSSVEVAVSIKNEQGKVSHSGSFNCSISPTNLVELKAGVHVIDFTAQDNEGFISLRFPNLKWVIGDLKTSLVIKKAWITEDAKILKPLFSFIEIQPGVNTPFEFQVTKNGKGTLKLVYAIKVKTKTIQETQIKKGNHGFINIRFEVKGLAEPGTKAKEVPLLEETFSSIPQAEVNHWKSCDQKIADAQIICLSNYLEKFPQGHFAQQAKEKLVFPANKKYGEIQNKLNRPNKKEELIAAAIRFLAIFPPEVAHYTDVERILETARMEEDIVDIQHLDTVVLPETKPMVAPPLPEPSKTVDPEPSVNPITDSPLEKSEEDLIIEQAQQQGNCEGFQNYLDKYPQGKYLSEAKIAKAKLCIINIAQDSIGVNRYRFTMENMFSFRLDSIIPKIDSSRWTLHPRNSDYAYELNVHFPDDRNYVLYFSDPLHPDTSRLRARFIDIGELLEAYATSTPDEIHFTFHKGVRPFKVYFRQAGGGVVFDTMTNENTIVIPKAYLKDQKGFSGEYSLAVADEMINTPMPPKGQQVFHITPDIWNWNYLFPIGGFVILLFFLGRKNRGVREKKQKQAERAAFMESRKQPLADLHKKKIDPAAWTKQTKTLPSQQQQAEEGSKQGVKQTANTGGIKIKRLRKSSKKVIHYSSEEELQTLINTGLFTFEPARHWSDSIIQAIYFTSKSIDQLDQFLVSQNLKPVQEKEGMVPEIGGILMGRPYQSDQDGKYRITVEDFVPINPEFHNVFQLEFSTQSLVKDLGDIQDQFPEYTAVGWFHTHPGHGLFLSKPDLVIQERFFGEPYQFAMEIDSLTPNLDTAFFTFSSTGKINNIMQKKEDTEWFSWLEHVASMNIS